MIKKILLFFVFSFFVVSTAKAVDLDSVVVPDDAIDIETLADAPYYLDIYYDGADLYDFSLSSNDQHGISFWSYYCSTSLSPVPVFSGYFLDQISSPQSKVTVDPALDNCDSGSTHIGYLVVGYQDPDLYIEDNSNFKCPFLEETSLEQCITQPGSKVFTILASKDRARIAAVHDNGMYANTCNSYSPFVCFDSMESPLYYFEFLVLAILFFGVIIAIIALGRRLM